jgi:hypothetical protein
VVDAASTSRASRGHRVRTVRLIAACLLVAVAGGTASASIADRSPPASGRAGPLRGRAVAVRTPTPASNSAWTAAGPRADLPFRPSPSERLPPPEALPAFWDDGRACSTGCRPVGAIDGWPLQPFHRQHALRAGLNERRVSGFHVGLDIQARDGQRAYAVQPGVAEILQARGVDARVRVGNYIYWHIRPSVRPGQRVTPYRTILGTVLPRAGHLHLSEVGLGGEYLNPLRPGGRVLAPWRDRLPPVLGLAHIRRDGIVDIAAYDPQSFRRRTTYETPVLAPAALAYAVFDSRGRRIGPLHWALRGSRLLPHGADALVYTRHTHSAGWTCFATQVVCRPSWRYHLAGGLAPALPDLGLAPGRYRLTAYAWDWAGNTGARDAWFRLSPRGRAVPSRTTGPAP